MFAAGATEALLGAVTHEDTTVRHYALTGLSNLCSYPGAASVIREHEAMGRLRKLASHANHPAATQPLKYAARIVGIVSEDAACATGEIVDAASSSSTSISQDSGSQDTPRSGSPQDTPRSS
uniref:Uncharacterized protein n=1 Tax=Prymnesium polylepis TaxID=72548 RepID=A0A7S4IXP8_9EUKA